MQADSVSGSRRHRADTRLLQLRPKPPRDPVEEHAEVADQRPERVGESGRAVLLDGEVAHPGEQISRDESGEEPPVVPRKQEASYAGEGESRADVVQCPRLRLGMLPETVGPEF